MGMKAQRHALSAVDVALTSAAALAGGALLAARRWVRRAPAPTGRRRLMAISYTSSLRVLRSRKAEHLITHRDLGSYFDHVWSVHPLVGSDPRELRELSLGPPTITRLGVAHTVIEGHTERSAALRGLPYLNFALAQLELVLLLDRT